MKAGDLVYHTGSGQIGVLLSREYTASSGPEYDRWLVFLSNGEAWYGYGRSMKLLTACN